MVWGKLCFSLVYFHIFLLVRLAIFFCKQEEWKSVCYYHSTSERGAFQAICSSYSSSHNFSLFFNCFVFSSNRAWNFFHYPHSDSKPQNPVLPCLSSCVFLWDPDWEDVPSTLSGPGRAGFHSGHLGRQCGRVFSASSWVVCASYLRSPFP